MSINGYASHVDPKALLAIPLVLADSPIKGRYWDDVYVSNGRKSVIGTDIEDNFLERLAFSFYRHITKQSETGKTENRCVGGSISSLLAPAETNPALRKLDRAQAQPPLPSRLLDRYEEFRICDWCGERVFRKRSLAMHRDASARGFTAVPHTAAEDVAGQVPGVIWISGILSS